MKIVNKSKDLVLSLDAGIAETLFSRAKGLMLSNPADLVLVSPKEDIPSSSIHMVLMRFQLDVLWLDSSKKVVDLKTSIPPFDPLKPRTWCIYRPAKPSKYVIELGKGGIGPTEPGDSIEFI
ncbi:MAG: DUF192 domain-containing protein [Candidatus Altiarchaeota archaeon]|nr:DUF192 domain-containing protein [Candidatus Altiarchaeota archaeon]